MLLDESEPFFRRLSDRVVFSRGSTVSDPVDVVVRFSELAPDSIAGEILGANATYATIQRVFEDRSDAFCKIESVAPNGPARLASNKVILRSISHSGWNGRQPADDPLAVVGHFECHELMIDERSSEPYNDLAIRAVRFYLSEDVVLWAPSSFSFGSETFSFESTQAQELDPGVECRFTMKGLPCLLYDNRRRLSRHRTLSCILPTILCSTTFPDTEYSDDAFQAEARALVDDVLLLASLACRRLVRWHHYAALGHYGRQTLVRSTCEPTQPSDLTGTRELPVQPRRFHQFVQLAIPKLREISKQALDFRLPILYVVGSFEAEEIDQQFSYAVLCLERLVDLHARSRGLNEIVPENVFKPLRHQLADEIKSALASSTADTLRRPPDEAIALMRDKLTELNRPPFWTLLSSLLDTYGVLWADLYPPGLARPTLIATRNKFIHSSEKPSYGHLIREAARVQVLCERLLLRMLGWEDLYPPNDGMRQWLVRPEKEQGDTT